MNFCGYCCQEHSETPEEHKGACRIQQEWRENTRRARQAMADAAACPDVSLEECFAFQVHGALEALRAENAELRAENERLRGRN